MKALVFAEPRSASVEELDVPSVAADEVLVRSRNVGICHSDFELYEGRYIIPVSYPIVPGHEWSGEVAEVGSAVANLRPGDRVVGECVVNNGDDHFGFSIGGADAEYFVARRHGSTAFPRSSRSRTVRSSSRFRWRTTPRSPPVASTRATRLR